MQYTHRLVWTPRRDTIVSQVEMVSCGVGYQILERSLVNFMLAYMAVSYLMAVPIVVDAISVLLLGTQHGL